MVGCGRCSAAIVAAEYNAQGPQKVNQPAMGCRSVMIP